MSYRPKRVGDEIRKVVSQELLRGLKDPVPGFVTIKDVEVNRDFTRAKVFFSVIGSDQEKAGAQEVLDAHRGYLRKAVGKAIRTRNTPELVFVPDESGERAARIHQLLDEVGAGQGDEAASGDEEE